MNIEILQKMIDSIAQENTGNPSQFACDLNVSERAIYKYISLMRSEFNAPIKYCRKRKSYCFTENGSLDLTWQE
jgi:hypothetical protein